LGGVVAETPAERFKREIEFKRRFIGKTPNETLGPPDDEQELDLTGKRNWNGQGKADGHNDAKSLSFRRLVTYGAGA